MSKHQNLDAARKTLQFFYNKCKRSENLTLKVHDVIRLV